MIIAIDVGNTNIVVGCMDSETPMFTARLATDKTKTPDEYAMLFMNVFHLHKTDLSLVKGSIISSVVPELKTTLSSAMRRLIGKSPLLVSLDIKIGIDIKIDFPYQLGSDRIVNAVAAISKYKCPMVIIDMGTATTLCVIDKNKVYRGGMIMPGLRLAIDALSNKAAQLPHIGLEEPEQVIGTNTISCMKSGAIYGNAAMIDGLVERIEKELGEKVTVIGTGGLTTTIIPHCKRKIISDSTLTLTGLKLIYDRNFPS